MGGNLGRDGDVEVAQAQALPVEAVEPPAISHMSDNDPHTLKRGRKMGHNEKWCSVCLVIFCVLALYAGWRNGQPLALSTTNWHRKSEAGIIRTINFVRRPIFEFMECET